MATTTRRCSSTSLRSIRYDNYQYCYHFSQIPTDANSGVGYNYLRLANDEMDAALNSLASAIAPEDQLEAAYSVQQVYLDQVPEVTLFYPVTAGGVSARLHNFMKNPSTASDMWNIQDWWITPVTERPRFARPIDVGESPA